jgi:lysophospholipase L1-like esterase
VQTLTATLPAGSGKTVELVAGSQAFNTYPYILGTYLRKATFNAAATKLTPTPTNPLVCYGDSITIGANSSSPPGQAWPVLVRQAYAATGTTRVEGWGSRSLYDDANTGTLRAALVALLTADSPAIIWIAIGTNDYGLNKWSAASFGTAYAALLDDLHTAAPSATIYCQSPIQRISPASEAANGSGSTLGNYRTQISTAVSTRSAYAVYVEGAAGAIVSDANMDTDGIHPKTAGQAQYAAFVETTLGI